MNNLETYILENVLGLFFMIRDVGLIGVNELVAVCLDFVEIFIYLFVYTWIYWTTSRSGSS